VLDQVRLINEKAARERVAFFVLSGRLDEREDDQAAKLLREVRNGSPSLAQFLRERQLIPVDDTYAIDQARKRSNNQGLSG
jgi:hypothetical protein